jgi:hypothetical protein
MVWAERSVRLTGPPGSPWDRRRPRRLLTPFLFLASRPAGTPTVPRASPTGANVDQNSNISPLRRLADEDRPDDLDDSLVEAVDRAAKDLGTTRSAFTRDALRAALTNLKERAL